MSNPPLVSIIVNCFNGEKYLNECLKSILNQSYKNYEVIFWDNKSTDNSKDIFLKIKDKRFKYFTDKEHVSLYCARNKALNLAKGDYISFLDVDDKWLPEKLNLQVNIMQSNMNIGFCFSGLKFLSDSDNNLKPAFNNKYLKNGNITSELLKNYNIGLLTLMLNKNIVDANNIKFDNRFNIMGDLDFVLRLSKFSLGAAIKSDLAIYRNHTNNLSNRIDLFVEERTLWQSEMLLLKVFSRKQLLPFIEETKYLDFRSEIRNYKFISSLKKLFSLKGNFFLKGLIIYLTKLINSFLICWKRKLLNKIKI